MPVAFEVWTVLYIIFNVSYFYASHHGIARILIQYIIHMEPSIHLRLNGNQWWFLLMTLELRPQARWLIWKWWQLAFAHSSWSFEKWKKKNRELWIHHIFRHQPFAKLGVFETHLRWGLNCTVTMSNKILNTKFYQDIDSWEQIVYLPWEESATMCPHLLLQL